MPRLTEDDRERIMADYHAGMSQNTLADKYQVSTATINKLCKNVKRKNLDKVNRIVELNQELAGASKIEMASVHREVIQKLADMEYIRRCSMKVIDKAIRKMEYEELSMYDLERAQNIIGKGRENIYGKTPDTAVQVNNQNQQITYRWEE